MRINSIAFLTILTSRRNGARCPPNLIELLVSQEKNNAGVNLGDRRAIYYLIRALKCQRILEIGSNVGASTLSIAAALKRTMASDGDVECGMVTVDIVDVNEAADAPWKFAKLTGSPKNNLAAIGMASRVVFETKTSLSYFDNCQDKFDFIFLDGDHAATTVYQEIPKALSKLRKNGTILLHDYFPGHRPLWNGGQFFPGPSLAYERLRQEGARLKVLPLNHLPWPTKLGTNITSLAIISSD
jgi:predicted O-methyltransferase YrrM